MRLFVFSDVRVGEAKSLLHGYVELGTPFSPIDVFIKFIVRALAPSICPLLLLVDY